MSETLSRDRIAAFIQDSLRVRASARTVSSVLSMWLANGVEASDMAAAIEQVASGFALDLELVESYRTAFAQMVGSPTVDARR